MSTLKHWVMVNFSSFRIYTSILAARTVNAQIDAQDNPKASSIGAVTLETGVSSLFRVVDNELDKFVCLMSCSHPNPLNYVLPWRQLRHRWRSQHCVGIIPAECNSKRAAFVDFKLPHVAQTSRINCPQNGRWCVSRVCSWYRDGSLIWSHIFQSYDSPPPHLIKLGSPALDRHRAAVYTRRQACETFVVKTNWCYRTV